MGPHRLPFKVAFCESQDEDHPPSQLLSPGPECKGWRSAQYCIYPQDLVLHLDSRSQVDRIQILIHNYMIPSAIEVQLGDVTPNPRHPDAPPDLKRALFASLGETPLDENREFKFKGRQMQTIELDGFNRGVFIKLLLKKNHLNRLNEDNQVALMGINIIGSPVDREENNFPPKLTHRDDLAFMMYTDADVAEVIRQLEACRESAKGDRREEYGSKLKDAIFGLEGAGLVLGAKGVTKVTCLENKDYQGAKKLEKEIHEERERLYREFKVAELLEKDGQLAANDERLTELNTPPRHKTCPKSRSPSPNKVPPPRRRTSLPPPRSPGRIPTPPSPARYRTPSPFARAAIPDEEIPPAASITPPPAPPKAYAHIYIDDRAIKPAKEAIAGEPEETAEDEKPQLTAKDMKILRMAIDVYGEDLILKAVSKSPQTKEIAHNEIHEQIKSFTPDVKPGKFLRGTTQILVKMLADKVWAVFNLGCSIVHTVFESFVPEQRPAAKEIDFACQEVYKELIHRSCDTTERVSDLAEQTIQAMLKVPAVQKSGVIQSLLVTPLHPTKEHPKLAFTKAELVLFMIDDLNLVDEGSTNVGILAKFALSAVNHTTSAVRKIGEKIMVRLYKMDPDWVREVMPPDNAKNRKANLNLRHLYEKFQKTDGKEAR